MRTTYCGLVSESLLDQTVTLMGWAHRRRDHGGVIFIDLRDREGLVQVVCDPDRAEMFQTAELVRSEFCLKITGRVRSRPSGTENAALTSGKIEVLCLDIEVLNPSVTPPFQMDDDNLSETTRLTHRVLDLRRPAMQRNLMLRYRVAMEVRKFLDVNGFIDIETPMLTKSTPEGARDYLVPSRVHEGQFFALPQSPQLFKQLLMVSGFDRYYQIVKCFRDEDLRADRQPEFTQIDIETSFLTEEEIRTMFEGMIRSTFAHAIDVELPPFPVMQYAEAMRLYGSDKPDLRVKMAFTELTDVMADVDFKVFSAPAQMKDGRVVALRVPGGAEMSRSEIDGYTEFVKIYGARGLAWIKVNDLAKGRDGLQSPIVKNLHDGALAEVLARSGAQSGDLLLFGADKAKVVNDAIGALRVKIGHSEFGKAHQLSQGQWEPLWVTDFPMYELNEETGLIDFSHNPFSMPQGEMDALETMNPLDILAYQYDIVCNGIELSSGAIRNHRPDIMYKAFEIAGYTQEQVDTNFAGMIGAFKLGAPPHGGSAPGIDRIVMLLADEPNIREVIVFPMNQKAEDLMMNAPAPATAKQLRELGIRVVD